MIKQLMMIAAMGMPVANADGLFVYGSAMRTLGATDYSEWRNGKLQDLRGLAEVKVGYAWQFDNARIETGLQHNSNPFTGDDYGVNGVFVGGCWGDC